MERTTKIEVKYNLRTYNKNDELVLMIVKGREVCSTLARVKLIKESNYERKKFTTGCDAHDDKHFSLIVDKRGLLIIHDDDPKFSNNIYANYVLDNNKIMRVVFEVAVSNYENNGSELYDLLCEKIEFLKC